MAYVETGPADGPTVVLAHGQPTWGDLYRPMTGPLAVAGLRVVVPDLVGFGRSDKPTAPGGYSYAGHVVWLRAALFDVRDLHDITDVGQDWGGLIGMRLLAEHPYRFARVVMANTGLPTGDVPMPEVWQRFRQMVQHSEHLDIAGTVDSGCLRTLSQQENGGIRRAVSHGALPRRSPGLPRAGPQHPRRRGRSSEQGRVATALKAGGRS